MDAIVVQFISLKSRLLTLHNTLIRNSGAVWNALGQRTYIDL